MICYSSSIVDCWRNRITEEKGTADRLGGIGEREEKMVWEDSDSHTPTAAGAAAACSYTVPCMRSAP